MNKVLHLQEKLPHRSFVHMFVIKLRVRGGADFLTMFPSCCVTS